MTTPNTSPATTNPVQLARELLKRFQEQFAVFREFMPLAIGIDKQLLARLPDLDRKVLRTALRIHTNSTPYLKKMSKATVRFDLDGNTADEVPESHREHALTTVRERFKKQADQRKAQRQADEEEKRRSEKLEQLAAKFSRRDKTN